MISMPKLNSKILLSALALCGIATSSLPWTGVYRGSLPPGNLPNTIFYGFQVNGIYCAACFLGIVLVCLLTSIKQSIKKAVALLSALLAGIILVICAIDIIPIVFQGNIVGTVPFLMEGPFLTGLIALIVMILALASLV